MLEKEETEKGVLYVFLKQTKEEMLTELVRKTLLHPQNYEPKTEEEILRNTIGKSYFYDKDIDAKAVMLFSNAWIRTQLNAHVRNAWFLLEEYTKLTNSTIMEALVEINEKVAVKDGGPGIEFGFGNKKILIMSILDYKHYSPVITKTEIIQATGCKYDSLEALEKSKEHKEYSNGN